MNYKIKSLLLILAFVFSCSKKKIEADILIKNGTVYNGIDTTSTNNSIAIKHDKIVFIGDENSASITAKKIIDANGMIVSPGFIDPHTHADRDLKNPKNSHNKPFLFQGITTVVTGNDGDSFYPTSKYISLYNTHKIGTNAVPLVGHGTIRKQVMGKSDRKARKQSHQKNSYHN